SNSLVVQQYNKYCVPVTRVFAFIVKHFRVFSTPNSPIIFGISSMENIPYHFYFILFLCLIAAVNFVLARYTTHAIYNKTSKVTQTDNQQDVSNDSTDEADTSS
ncbi:hypothetical protein ACT6QE_10830, partial [Staphylococcus aureus]